MSSYTHTHTHTHTHTRRSQGLTPPVAESSEQKISACVVSAQNHPIIQPHQVIASRKSALAPVALSLILGIGMLNSPVAMGNHASILSSYCGVDPEEVTAFRLRHDGNEDVFFVPYYIISGDNIFYVPTNADTFENIIEVDNVGDGPGESRVVYRTETECNFPMNSEAMEAEEEAQTAANRDSSRYLSQTVSNRIRSLFSGRSDSFVYGQTADIYGSGMSAGEGDMPFSLDNISFDVSYVRTNSSGAFNTDALYALLMTDKLIDSKRVAGFGLGVERSHQRIVPDSTSVKSEGVTLTGYYAQILNPYFTFVPQGAITYLDKRTYPGAGGRAESNAWRGFASLGMLGQRQFEWSELSGLGQLVYTNENPHGSGSNTYVGQARLDGELSFMPESTTRPFLGATVDYDITKSDSGPRFGYGGTAGVRSALDSGSLVTLSVSHAWREGQERTLTANAFVKIFF